MLATPSKVVPVDAQMPCLAEECGRFLETKDNTAIPSMNIETRRPKIEVVTVGLRPRSLTNGAGVNSSCRNKHTNTRLLAKLASLNRFNLPIMIHHSGFGLPFGYQLLPCVSQTIATVSVSESGGW